MTKKQRAIILFSGLALAFTLFFKLDATLVGSWCAGLLMVLLWLAVGASLNSRDNDWEDEDNKQ